ncbi:hypothetical protein EV359DRAFT_84557 [Lentinula novae-zelandiae]|nr:hypothetical protein EV359DRAFT_84557 [Lentinula novae-zelandiae]
MSSDVPSQNTRSRRLGMGGAGTDGAKATDSAKDLAAQDKPSSYDEVCSSHPLRDAAIPHTVPIANASKAMVGTSGNNPTGSANVDEVSSEYVNQSNVDEINENSSGLSSAPDSEDDGQGLWTTVQSRRSKSLDNLKTRKDFFKPAKLTKEQKATVKAAEQRMTPAQCEIINNQNLAIQKQQQARSYSKPQDVGPSSYVAKGKFVDHNNEVCDTELNIEVQKAKLNHWNAAHGSIGAKNLSSDVESEISDKSQHQLRKNYHHKNGSQRHKSRNSKSEHLDLGTDDSANVHKKTKTSSRCISKDVESLKPISSHFAKKIKDIAKSHETTSKSTTHHGRHLSTQPVDQLPQDSLLAQMIKTKKQSKKSIKIYESSSESTTSNSSSSPSSEELDSSDESVQHRKRHRHCSRSHSQKRNGRKSKKRTYNRIIKPVPPSIWNGEADAEVCQRIVLEGYQFCKEGKIPKNERVFLISHYLSGKAYQFFALKVAKNHSKWSLQEFYEGLVKIMYTV